MIIPALEIETAFAAGKSEARNRMSVAFELESFLASPGDLSAEVVVGGCSMESLD